MFSAGQAAGSQERQPAPEKTILPKTIFRAHVQRTILWQ